MGQGEVDEVPVDSGATKQYTLLPADGRVFPLISCQLVQLYLPNAVPTWCASGIAN